MTLTTSADWAYYLLICGGMGMTGQFIRAIGGAKKVNDQATSLNTSFSNVFDLSTFLTSMITGFSAGIIAGLSLKPDTIDTQFLLGVLAAGYTGADFIEAFLKKSPPDVQKAANISGGLAMLPAARTMTSPRVSVSVAVKQVIADFKHIDPGEVTDAKKLSDLSYDDTDCIALENELNLYFFNVLNLQFDRLLEGPDDIKEGFTVSQVVAKVNSVHPRPRP